MSRPDIIIVIISRTIDEKTYLFTVVYFRTSLIKVPNLAAVMMDSLEPGQTVISLDQL